MRRFWAIRRGILAIVLLFFVGTAIIYLSQTRRNAAPVAAFRQTTLVIDAGHGGLDGGAVSADGDRESAINLAVALRLYDLCRLFGQSAVMTRESETLDYPPEASTVREKKVWDQKRRLELVNASPEAVFLSIHQNNYPDARPSGTQVLYAGTEGSEAFATYVHELLRQHLCPENRRVAAPASDDIYLMKQVNCPAILVECGFLSNPEEARKLTDPSYQTKLAAILCAACLNEISPAI